MKRRSKRYKLADNLIEKNKIYSLEEAIGLLKKMPHTKFDETVEISFHLNIDPKQTDQFIRGSILLPHGTGKSRKILVFCKGEKERLAKEAGADYVGAKELVDKIKAGWLDFDVAIAEPEMMKEISQLGRILGPRGLMPSPKSGTVTADIMTAIAEIKKGKIEFKTDKSGNLHFPIGKVSFEENRLIENAASAIEVILRSRPSSVKGQFVKSVTISTTMNPGLRIDWGRIG